MKVWFIRLLLISLVLTYLVILAGAVVRTTGSGMGCPDWPKCFGQYVPPTDIAQLPADYKEVFKVEGKTIADFDAFKTWVEYINRLLGALLGLAVFAALVASFAYRKENKKLIALSALSVVLVGLAAWLGAKVVFSNLAVSSITIHMMVSFAIITSIVFAFIYARLINTPPTVAVRVPRRLRNMFITVLVLFVLQVIMGTQVRQEIDSIATMAAGDRRDTWIELLSGIFQIHRSFSLVITGMILYLLIHVFRYYRQNTSIYKPLAAAAGVTMLEICTGIVMSYFSIPAAVQPIHLLFSAIIFGLLAFSFISMVLRSRSYAPNSLAAK